MHFTVEAQNIAKGFLSEGAIAIDATVGNGFDTLFLAQAVGDSGVVYGLDVQATAIENVQRKLTQAKLAERCRLFALSHAKMSTVIDSRHFGQVSVAMFNLGYLPFGDKSIVTTSESTLAALDETLRLVRSGGLISLLAYLGHAGGTEEANEVSQWVDHNSALFEVERFQDTNNPRSPILWTLIRN